MAPLFICAAPSAHPNKLVEITDPLSGTSPAAGETFRTLRAASFGGSAARRRLHPGDSVSLARWALWMII
jgi:hypothetical protein